jgi:hypothetical protein
VNIAKTKVMQIGKKIGTKEERGKYPCGVCGKGVGANSIKCTQCEKWIHCRCSGLKKGSLSKAQNFKCKTCTSPKVVDSKKLIDDKYEIVDQFCYLGNIFEAEGGVKAATRDRIQKTWNSWRKLTPILMQKDLSLKIKGWMYKVGVRSTLLYGVETWPMTTETLNKLEGTQMRMLRWMAGISRLEKRTNESIRRAFGVESIEQITRKARLRWFGHVERREENHVTRICEN